MFFSTLAGTEKNHIKDFFSKREVLLSPLTMWKGCENVSNYGHSQYCEWPSLAKFSQPFHCVNGLLIKGSYFSFSFILPKNEAVTIFWLHNSTIQFGLEQLYGFCD